MFRALILTALLALGLVQPLKAGDQYLLMAEQAGCSWCAKWHAELGEIYPKTPEGRLLPLRRYDIRRDEAPAQLARPVLITPTFIIVRDGVEVARIEGYPGDDLFWAMLEVAMRRAGIAPGAVTGQETGDGSG